MNFGESCCGEVCFCDNPRPRRFLGAILARIYQIATYRAAVKLGPSITGSTKIDPP